MNARQVQAVLDTIDCDDWQLTATDDPFHGVRFRAVKTGIPDNFDPDSCIDKGIGDEHEGGVLMRLPRNATEQDVVWWVYLRMAEDVIHEFRERFKVNGRAIFNPHAQESA